MFIFEVSTITAPFAARKGLIFLFVSSESLAFIELLTWKILIFLLFFLYSRSLLFAFVFKEHLKNNFKSDFAPGSITVPISLPSTIHLLDFAKFFWKDLSRLRTNLILAIVEAYSVTSGL